MFKSNGSIIWIIFLLLFFISKTLFCYEYVGHRYQKNNFPTFYVNQNGTPDCSGEFTDIQSSLQTWNGVNTTYINFAYGGTVATNTRSNDGTNLMMWVESGWRNIFPGNYSIAINTTWYYVGSGIAIESDILFNGEDYSWSDNGAAGRYDVQNIATHEVGHSVGLDDLYGGGDTEKTMYYGSSTGETKKSTLDIDDQDGARYVNFEAQNSGTLNENQVWAPNLNNNTISLTNNLNISSYTLSIKSGITVNLNNYSVTSTSGTIPKEAGATINGLRATSKYGAAVKGLFPTTQLAINNAGNFYNIYVESGTFNEYLSVSNKLGLDIIGEGKSSTRINGGITFVNSDASGVSHLTSYYNEFSNSSDVTTLDHEIIQAGWLYCYYCVEADLSPTINNSEDGVVLLNYSTGCLIDFYSEFKNDDVGVTVNQHSDVYISQTTFCSNDYDIKTYNYSYANATGGGVIFSDYPAPVYGNVTLPQSYSTCVLQKSSASTSINKNGSVTNDPAYEEFTRIMNSYNNLSLEVRNDTRMNGEFNTDKYSGRYNDFIDSAKSFIEENPNSNWSKTVLAVAINCYKKLNNFETMKSYLDIILGNKNQDLVKGLAKRFMIDYFNKQEDYTKSISLADEIINEEQADKELLCDVQFKKGLIYQYSLEKNDEAAKCYLDILNNYPDNKLTKLAKNHLKLLGIEVDENTKPNKATSGSVEFSTSSFPNPFNPVTTINYTLPTEEKVVIKVYDILGREITTLVNEEKTAGTYIVSFDASGFASGIYFYSIKAGKFNQVKKIVLAK